MKPKYTGLWCPSCRDAVAVVEAYERPRLVLRCIACGHIWAAEEAGEKRP